jgi:hypothetical protein
MSMKLHHVLDTWHLEDKHLSKDRKQELRNINKK